MKTMPDPDRSIATQYVSPWNPVSQTKPMTDWHPASTLPSTKGPHLAFCGLGSDGVPIYFVATWDVFNGVWRDDEGGLIFTLTHWQAITAPKENL